MAYYLIYPTYAAPSSLTITLSALASAAFRASSYVENTNSVDVLVSVSVISHASIAPTGDKAVYVYAYGSTDAGVSYPDGITGVDALITPPDPPNLKRIGVISATTANTTYRSLPMSIAAAFGAVPQRWGIVVRNSTGAALGTGGSASYQLCFMNAS